MNSSEPYSASSKNFKSIVTISQRRQTESLSSSVDSRSSTTLRAAKESFCFFTNFCLPFPCIKSLSLRISMTFWFYTSISSYLCLFVLFLFCPFVHSSVRLCVLAFFSPLVLQPIGPSFPSLIRCYRYLFSPSLSANSSVPYLITKHSSFHLSKSSSCFSCCDNWSNNSKCSSRDHCTMSNKCSSSSWSRTFCRHSNYFSCNTRYNRHLPKANYRYNYNYKKSSKNKFDSNPGEAMLLRIASFLNLMTASTPVLVEWRYNGASLMSFILYGTYSALFSLFSTISWMFPETSTTFSG